MIVLWFLGGGINQTRIRCRIPWLEILDRLEVARIRDDNGKFLQLLKLTQLRFALLRFDSGCAHDFLPPVIVTLARCLACEIVNLPLTRSEERRVGKECR